MSIHIKPANRGKLHRALGVKQGTKISTAAEERAAHSKNPKLRREAQFALNAKKWAH